MNTMNKWFVPGLQNTGLESKVVAMVFCMFKKPRIPPIHFTRASVFSLNIMNSISS